MHPSPHCRTALQGIIFALFAGWIFSILRQPGFQIGTPYSVPGGWAFSAQTYSGPTIEFLFPELVTTKVYQTVGHTSPGPGEVFVSFYSGFITGSLSPGSKVYMNRLNEGDLFEVVICDGGWEYGSGEYLLNTRLLVSF